MSKTIRIGDTKYHISCNMFIDVRLEVMEGMLCAWRKKHVGVAGSVDLYVDEPTCYELASNDMYETSKKKTSTAMFFW